MRFVETVDYAYLSYYTIFICKYTGSQVNTSNTPPPIHSVHFILVLSGPLSESIAYNMLAYSSVLMDDCIYDQSVY